MYNIVQLLSLGVAIQNNSQNSQHPMAAIPQHLNPTDVANPSAVLLSPPVRKTRIQQPKPETGKFHIIQKASVFSQNCGII